MLSDTLQRPCDPVVPVTSQRGHRHQICYEHGCTLSIGAPSGPGAGFHGTNLRVSYLLECQGLGPLLGGSRLPHTDGGAGATGDDQLWVGTYGTEDLTPLGQTLIHHQRLE